MTHISFAVRRALVGLALILVPAAAHAQQSTTVQAYRQAMTYLATTLQQSDKPAASDALITVIAVHKTLSRALDIDRARVQAASRQTELGEAGVVEKLADAEDERTSHILFTGHWIATANAESRQLAIDGTSKAIADTEAAVSALGPLVQQIQGVSLPPALLLDVVPSRDPSGTFLLLVTVQNVGNQAAQSVKLTLRNGASAGGATQEITLGALAPGATLQHVFGVGLPAGQAQGTTAIEVSATNATSEVFSVDLGGTE